MKQPQSPPPLLQQSTDTVTDKGDINKSSSGGRTDGGGGNSGPGLGEGQGLGPGQGLGKGRDDVLVITDFHDIHEMSTSSDVWADSPDYIITSPTVDKG